MTYHGFETSLTRRVTRLEHLSSPPVLGGARVVRSLVLCVFVDRTLSFCTFSFANCFLRLANSDWPFGVFVLFFSTQCVVLGVPRNQMKN